MKKEDLQKQFEATGYINWLNSDFYPDGKIYSKEYTEWFEKQTKESQELLAVVTDEMKTKINYYEDKLKRQHIALSESINNKTKELQEQIAEADEILKASEKNYVGKCAKLEEQLAAKDQQIKDLSDIVHFYKENDNEYQEQLAAKVKGSKVYFKEVESELVQGKTLEYWRENAKEDYITTPISVLKYITVLEEVINNLKKGSHV